MCSSPTISTIIIIQLVSRALKLFGPGIASKLTPLSNFSIVGLITHDRTYEETNRSSQPYCIYINKKETTKYHGDASVNGTKEIH